MFVIHTAEIPPINGRPGLRDDRNKNENQFYGFLTLGLFGRRVIVVTCVCPSVRLSVCLSVPLILVNTITQSVYPISPPNLLGGFNVALSWMVLFKGLIMDGCVLLTSTPECVVSPRGDPSGCALGITRRGETTHSGVDVNNTHPSMINPDYNMILAYLTLNYQYFAY